MVGDRSGDERGGDIGPEDLVGDLDLARWVSNIAAPEKADFVAVAAAAPPNVVPPFLPETAGSAPNLSGEASLLGASGSGRPPVFCGEMGLGSGVGRPPVFDGDNGLGTSCPVLWFVSSRNFDILFMSSFRGEEG